MASIGATPLPGLRIVKVRVLLSFLAKLPGFFSIQERGKKSGGEGVEEVDHIVGKEPFAF